MRDADVHRRIQNLSQAQPGVKTGRRLDAYLLQTKSLLQTVGFGNTQANQAGQQAVDIIPQQLICTEQVRINREKRLDHRTEAGPDVVINPERPVIRIAGKPCFACADSQE